MKRTYFPAIAKYATPLFLAFALVHAPANANDPRLVERVFNPDEVVRINGKTKVQATIKFADDETIENVAIGDSNAWQVTPNKRGNVLFVKPLSPLARTNLTVITSQRTYLFDLHANPRNRPLYVLSFAYPDAPKTDEPPETGLAQQEPESANETELAAASDPYAVVDPSALNFAWKTSGNKELFPEKTYDDGTATFLTWPKGSPIPAILVRDARGTEGPVNFTVRGDTIVVAGVPEEIVLRSGRDSALLTHAGPAPKTRAGKGNGRSTEMAYNNVPRKGGR